MIKFADGKRISSVVISTALGINGSGMLPYAWWPNYRKLLQLIKEKEITVFAKTPTKHPLTKNFILHKPSTWKFPRNSPLNAHNAINSNIEVGAKRITISHKNEFATIPSICPRFSKETGASIREILKAIDILSYEPDFWALEVSYFCQKSKEAISKNLNMALICTNAIKKIYPDLALIIKTSLLHPLEFYQQLADCGADVIHIINAAPYEIIFPEKTSPLQNIGGGIISGGPIPELAYRHNEKVRKAIPNTPLIMGGGIINRQYAIKFFEIGANAISLCTIGLHNPKEARKIINYACMQELVLQ